MSEGAISIYNYDQIECVKWAIKSRVHDSIPFSDSYNWLVFVEDRGSASDARYAVTHIGKCLNRKGEWDYEMNPSSRTDKWLRKHRFTLEEAMNLALVAVERVTVNGLTAEQAVEREVTP